MKYKSQLTENNDKECIIDLFNYPPVNLSKTEMIVPFGLMSGNHVTSVDHQHFQN
ncbi:hypothetical protein GF327_08210 [Candidatus Woesearchaeota archaeon]|nr:hypothetical protein [Candidatus Woesearchaeota archaeon]